MCVLNKWFPPEWLPQWPETDAGVTPVPLSSGCLPQSLDTHPCCLGIWGLRFVVLPCCFHHVDHVHGSVSHGSAHTGELGRLVLSPQGVFEPCFCSCWLLHLVLFPSLGQAVPESVAEVPLATLVTVSGAAGGISLSVPSKELHFINHFNFATFTLFSLSGASLVPILFFQATMNGIEMWEIFFCLMNCASEVSFCSWITILSFPLHCQAFPARDSCVPAFFSSPTLSLHHCSFAPCSTT